MPADMPLAAAATLGALPEIPVWDVGPRFAIETLDRIGQGGRALLETASAGHPQIALRIGDLIARRWLQRWRSPYLAEIEEIAGRVGRPGVVFFNVHYEWACTTAARPGPDGRSARLIRTLDWHTPGIGRHIMAARVSGAQGPWITLAWPGYAGVLQAMAPGRFSASINQAPMRAPSGRWAVDRLAFARAIWRSPHLSPVHVLRRAFETARSYLEAKAMLTATPVCAPAIFTLAGVAPCETCVIERLETEARVIEDRAVVGANDWQSDEWCERRWPGTDSAARAARIEGAEAHLDPGFPWLVPPILGEETRLAMVADAAEGRLIAQGYEAGRPATAVLHIG